VAPEDSERAWRARHSAAARAEFVLSAGTYTRWAMRGCTLSSCRFPSLALHRVECGGSLLRSRRSPFGSASWEAMHFVIHKFLPACLVHFLCVWIR